MHKVRKKDHNSKLIIIIIASATKERPTKMASILSRPVDLLIVVVFFSFILIAATIDYTQALYGSILAEEDIDEGIWPPLPVLRAYAWWCEYVDPLLGHNPSWYAAMAAFSPFLYVPFYIVAIYAFVKEKEWIRIPALMWGYGLLLTMFVVLKEELYGPYPTKNATLFLAAYGPYALIPLLVMVRVARYPVFARGNSEPGETKKGGNKGQKDKETKKKK